MDHYPPEMKPLMRRMATWCRCGAWAPRAKSSAAIVFLLSPAAAFVSGACLRVDGAAPNAKRIWPEVGTGTIAEAFDGFHLATLPKVLQDN